MTDDPRVQELIEEMFDSRKSLEDLCRDVPELLPQVRDGWRRFRAIEARISELFPDPDSLDDDKAATREIAPPQIPGYDVLNVLGRGGVGVVYKAVHRRLHRTVAIKMLLAGAFATRAEHQRFAREAEAVAALRHPNVVQIHDVGDVDGRPYFTMEFVDGDSLAQKLGGTPLPSPEAAGLLITIAGAVHAAHQAGIVHRDLKPANVLLTSDGTPKVSDFGLARRLDDKASLTRTGTAVGTPSYMAPEQARGRAGAAGPAADVYALGAILYELLTGRPPFRAETAEETVQQLLSYDPVSPSRLNGKVPRDLETICLKCLNKDPRLRYATAAALTDDLKRFLDGRPIHARPLSWTGRVWRSSRRNPAAAALISSVFVLVGLALGGGLWLERQQSEHAAETARREGRTAQAVEAALQQAAAHQAQGRWLEARAALAAAPSLLDTDPLADLPKRVRQACSDADTATELEAIRLGMSEGRRSDEQTAPSATQLYAEAFRKYGIELSKSDPATAAAIVRRSAIRDTLLAYLHDWLYWISEEQKGSLRSVLDLSDDDQWRRAYRAALSAQDTRKLLALAAAPGAPDQPPMILSGLGGTLLVHDLRVETLTLLREAQRRHPSDFWINYLLGHVLEQENPQEAVGYFRAAVAIRPRSDQAYTLLGRALRGVSDGTGAVAALKEALTLNPSRTGVWDLARVLAPAGRLEELRVAWEKYLESDPPDHDSWHGYAQLCLYLGNDAAYQRARKALLDRFAARPIDWIVAERTATACLLRPSFGDEFQRVMAVADRAVADAARFPNSDNPFVKFVTGFAEYRQNRLDKAVQRLRDAAEKLHDRAGPRLVLAMAQFRSGSTRDALQTLATAIRSFDWKGSAEETLWVSHVLRREAENMIFPHVPPFLRSGRQTREPDERLALAGLYQSKGLNHSAARLFREGFAVDSHVADDMTADWLDRAQSADQPAERTEALRSECRYLAARSAAVVGCGLGNDGVELGEAERADWRRQALQWLRADLTFCGKPAASETQTDRDVLVRFLTLWRNEPDLASLRDSNALEKLEPAERLECQTLWSDFDSLLKRAQGPKF